MGATHRFGEQGLANRIVRVEGNVSRVASSPGGLGVTVERAVCTLKLGEPAARSVAMNLHGRIGLGAGIGFVPPAGELEDA